MQENIEEASIPYATVSAPNMGVVKIRQPQRRRADAIRREQAVVSPTLHGWRTRLIIRTFVQFRPVISRIPGCYSESERFLRRYLSRFFL